MNIEYFIKEMEEREKKTEVEKLLKEAKKTLDEAKEALSPEQIELLREGGIIE